MPRRETPDPTARAVGLRIRQLRSEKGLTAERLAFESDLGSKGFLSDIEQGKASPSLRTLQTIADYLEVELVDLLTFPERSDRDTLIDRTRWLGPGAIRKLIRDMPLGPAGGPAPPKGEGRKPLVKARPAEPYANAGPGKKLVVAEPKRSPDDPDALAARKGQRRRGDRSRRPTR